jgi:hypothetical protein
MEMPDLPPAEKSAEQRRALKFWVDHCARLEAMIGELRAQLNETKGLLEKLEKRIFEELPK